MLKSYLLQNWILVLILAAFAVALYITVFLDRKTVRRLYILIVTVFLLSIVVFVEFYLASDPKYRGLRTVLMAVRYSATPFILAQIIYTLVKRQRWYVFIPALVLPILDVISIPTGIVFSITKDNVFVRGLLGYLPFVVAGGYCVFLLYLLIKRSNKKWVEIVPVIFMSLAFLSGLIFPFVFGSDFSAIFCSTIAVALFVYYVFMILEQTKKDPLTGLLNRHAFNADILKYPEEITAVLSIDMNGLKAINDEQGHAAGDEALATVALCFTRSLRHRQYGYRIGGDEFAMVCRRTSEEELHKLTERINSLLKETIYSCSVGYCYCDDGKKTVEEMLKEADSMMYAAKARHYAESGKDRRRR